MTGARGPRLVVVTGLSGSGKSFVAHAFEDIGYTTVDNLPLSLLDAFATELLAGKIPRSRTAVVLDVRNPDFAEVFPGILDALRRRLATTVLFLDCEDRVLLNRFSETRRPHPLAEDRSVADAVAHERRLLAEVKELSDIVVDTSGMTVHELRGVVADHFREPGDPGVLAVQFVSFGYKHGLPPALDLCFDVRFLANPHFDARLRPGGGPVRRGGGEHGAVLPAAPRLPPLVPARVPPGEPGLPHRRRRLHRRAPPFRVRDRAPFPRRRRRGLSCARVAPRRGPRDPMTTAQRPAAPAPNAPVGLLLVSHGPLAAALRDTIRVLEPDDPEDVEALSLAWDEAPEHASQRLEKAIGRANRGRGVVLLTDMFGGTPSNLALAFLDRGRIEIVSGVNLPMVVKARALAREGK